jgi:glutathione S-transferase
MYVLHYAPDNASVIIRLVLEQAGLPYRTALVDRSIRQQDSPAYRRLNPSGLIPTLETPHGPLSETAAILLWLADTHGLAPDPRTPNRPALLKWLLFLSNTAHADLRQIFYPTLYVPFEAIAAHYVMLTERMLAHFALLDAAAGRHPRIFAPTGILAPYVCALLRWSVLYPLEQTRWLDLDRFPHLATLCRDTEALASAQRVALLEGLGPKPFSNPELPRPAEGSVL